MLKNPSNRPEENDTTRRWISDDYFDLFLWCDTIGGIRGFQLCYDKPGRERALTWTAEKGLEHHAVDGGEAEPTEHRSPMLMMDATFPAELVRHEFEARSVGLSAEIRELVLGKIAEYGGGRECLYHDSSGHQDSGITCQGIQ